VLDILADAQHDLLMSTPERFGWTPVDAQLVQVAS